MFLDRCLGFSLELVDEFTKIIRSAFRPYIDHHRGLFACVKSAFFLHIQTTDDEGPKVLEIILVNSSTNSNLKPRLLSGSLEGS